MYLNGDGKPPAQREADRDPAAAEREGGGYEVSDVSIKRPVFAFMMTAALVVLGLFSYRDLGLDLMPKTDFPVVFINTSLPGASSEEVETQITKPIEEVVNTISGVDELRASSDQGFSRYS